MDLGDNPTLREEWGLTGFRIYRQGVVLLVVQVIQGLRRLHRFGHLHLEVLEKVVYHLLLLRLLLECRLLFLQGQRLYRLVELTRLNGPTLPWRTSTFEVVVGYPPPPLLEVTSEATLPRRVKERRGGGGVPSSNPFPEYVFSALGPRYLSHYFIPFPRVESCVFSNYNRNI